MDVIWAAVIGAFAGIFATSVGSVTTFLGGWLERKSQQQQEYLRVGVELAREDWQRRQDVAEKEGRSMLPIAVHLHYHTRLMELVAKDNLTPEADVPRVSWKKEWRNLPS